MSVVKFEWDERKSTSNLKKHGISFEEAKSAFSDIFARLIPDPDHSREEERFILLGTSLQSRLLVVCHCVRAGDSIRIISARKADRNERRVYEERRHA
ncbi:MAG: BrnT family toxin [Pseudomonadota bacterium]